MKCPYQKIIIHKPEDIDGYVIHFAKDIVEFGNCVKNECPFYYTNKTVDQVEHCRRAESEG